MQNPSLQPSPFHELPDAELVTLALAGNSAALEQVLERQQIWIFNLAFYMLHLREDAEDATQEVLVKIATNLATFRGESAFRTWARKIAIRHVLDARRSRPETVVTGFDCYIDYLDKAADADVYAERGRTPETALLVEEARISCTLGMLLCLDREQRLVFLLGEVMETEDSVGAELLEITKDNFRQRLCRAREQLSSFMGGRCSLMNPKSPCRCAKKTSAFIRDGIVDPERLQFTRGHLEAVSSEAVQSSQTLGRLLVESQGALRPRYPSFEPPTTTHPIAAILNRADVRGALNLS